MVVIDSYGLYVSVLSNSRESSVCVRERESSNCVSETNRVFSCNYVLCVDRVISWTHPILTNSHHQQSWPMTRSSM